jgi:multiple sugar transport system permease protein
MSQTSGATPTTMALNNTDAAAQTIPPPARTIPMQVAAPARIRQVLINTSLLAIGAAFLLPLLWLLLAAFNPHATASLSAPRFSLHNFHYALQSGAGGAIFNSLYLAGVSTVVTTVFSTLAGYGLSRRRVPFKGVILIGVLFLSALPVTMLIIPTYQMFVTFGWLNSPFYTSLVLGATALPFAVWLLKNFIDQVPREFEEAAAAEGANELRILWRVIVPLALPGILVSAILTFINSWGSFVIPLILDANPGESPAAVGIYQFMSANGQVQFGPLAAYGLLFSIPVIILYVISSRWLSGGFSFAGGIKG